MAGGYFCNVDLDIESKSDLTILKSELGRKVIALSPRPSQSGLFFLRLETAREYKTPDKTMCALCSLLERLSPKGKRAWRRAYKKEFDVGYEMARDQLASQFSLRAGTLARLVALGATLGITFYKPQTRRRTPKQALG